MEKLPFEVLLGIFKYLQTNEIYLHLSQVNKYFYSISESRYLMQYLLWQACTLHEFPKTDQKQSKKILKALSRKDPKKLAFIGFVTSGGVDENLMAYWCANLFRTEGEAYCAHDDSQNCVAGGVLLDCMEDPRTYFNSEESVKDALQSFSSDIKLDPFHLRALKNALLYLKGMGRSIPDIIQRIDSETHIKIPQLSDVRRFPNNNYVLQDNIDISHAKNSGYLGIIKQLKISRAGQYTCPVKSLMVFVSEIYIDVLDPEFQIYNDIKSSEKLLKVLDSHAALPEIYVHKKMNNYEYCELVPTRNTKITPVVWVKFKYCDKVTIKLSHCFAGKFIYVKLMNPEDKRNGAHTDMNIDCRYVIPYGCIINLGKEY